MRKKFTALLLISFLLAINTNAQTASVVEKIIETGKTDNQTMDHLDILCNRFGGRLIGSDAYENAAITTAIVVYGIANLDHLLSRDGYYIKKVDKPVKKKRIKM